MAALTCKNPIISRNCRYCPEGVSKRTTHRFKGRFDERHKACHTHCGTGFRYRVQIPRGLFTRRSPTGHTLIALFLLLAMESVLPQTRAILFDAKFLSAGLSPDGIVVVAALFTHEKNRFSFLLTSGHREGSGYRLIWAIWKFRAAIIAVQRPFRQVEMTTLATFLGSALLKNRRISRLRSRKSFEKPILTTSQLLL